MNTADLALWPHQKEAIDLIESYLTNGQQAVPKSALIRMPTGTGKSGVIAVTAHSVKQRGDILLLTPWDALAQQLGNDVSCRFWTRIGATPPDGPSAQRLMPSTAARQFAEATEGTIWVATTAALRQLHVDYHDDYRSLSERLVAVIVDEGHYEPARSWSQAVRGLNRLTVLFTATPYRNDLKYFNVDGDFYFELSHAAAERERYLRRVKFKTITFDSPQSFCDGLLATVDDRLSRYQDAKIIVRCQSKNSVQAVALELANRNRTVVGVHEGFTDADPFGLLRSQVPNPESEPARFWVHQFKLTEGIDAEAFRMVAFYEPFSNERAFVQQVGRVLRNPGQKHNQDAWIVGDPHSGLEDSWASYRQYEAELQDDGLPPSPRELARQQPHSQYLDGRFRTTFDLDAPNLHVDFQYPLSVQIFEVTGDFDLDGLTKNVEDALTEADFELGAPISPADDTWLHPYIAVRNSPLLFRSAFVEYQVGFTFYRRTGKWLFYSDTQGVAPPALDQLPPVSPSLLRRLYSGRDARLTQMTTVNTDLGPHSIRRRSIYARSIDDLGPDLTDHAYVASTSSGRTAYRLQDGRFDPNRRRTTTQRYVGYANSRVRDGGKARFDRYMQWLDVLASSLSSSTKTLSVFQRYADIVDDLPDYTASNILLDIPEQTFEEAGTSPTKRLDIGDLCMEVVDGEFTCRANGADYLVSIRWTGRRYQLSCPDLDDRFSMTDSIGDPTARSLIRYVNHEQSFRVVPALVPPDYAIYVGGLFCRPHLPLAGSASLSPDLLELFTGVPALRDVTNEKGAPGSARASGWEVGSLFHLIDTLGRGTALAAELRDTELLVCDDMQTETCDFVAVTSRPRRVIVMHLKAFPDQKRISASAFHEVSSQALKNLGYFEPYNSSLPSNLNRWSGSWRDGRIGTVAKRIRRGTAKTGPAAWDQIQTALRDPNTIREIWIVLGKGPPRFELEERSTETPPSSELFQLLYSLQATWTAVTSIGARLRVFSAT